MADTYNILINTSTVSITRTLDNSVIFSSDYNYLTYDVTGTILWPASPTMSSAGGNLTWQFNGQQISIHNTYYAVGAKAFDTYIIPMKAYNPTVTSDAFVDYEAANVENTGNAV